MTNEIQNCLLGKDAAILRFHPSDTFAVGRIVLYQPLDEGHPPEVWYQAKIASIRESGYLELQPLSNCYTTNDDSAAA